ncbi:MAG TPA: acetyltransferase [Desulfosporosinus sp.]|nr:acetyltransferase [Desulfosporosinus sp.]
MERVVWVDVLKGLGIMAVVWGHSGSKNAFYMFWFHMPLFFFISGYLYRLNSQQTELSYIKRKVNHLLVPYAYYLMLLALGMFSVSLWRGQSAAYFWSANWKAFLLGGSLLEGVYATFWFTTCLFFVQIGYDFLCRKIPSGFYKGLIVLVAFLIAYWQSRYLPESFVPWNMDVGLYALVFYAGGHFCKQTKLLDKPSSRKIVLGVSFILFIGFIHLYSRQILDYGLDMKHRQYYYFGLNLILPLIFTFFLVQLSLILSKWQVFNKTLIRIGRAAMVIMYLHIPSVYIVRQIIPMTPVRFFVVGILCPLLFYMVIQSFPYGRFLALGEPMNKGREHSA